jgi:hypothetical protein
MGSNIGTTEDDLFGAALLEEQLNIVKEGCNNIAKEMDLWNFRCLKRQPRNNLL